MAANFDKVRAALVNQFRTAWPTSSPPAALALAKIQMPNTKFDRPSAAPWASLTIRSGNRGSAAVGGARVRQIGVLFLQVFVPEDSGTKVTTDAADTLARIFDNQTLTLAGGSGFIRCGFVQESATGERDGYFQATFTLTFEHDQNL